MNPFRYPKSRHKRTISPSTQKSNRQYKPLLKQEFGGKCVYCRLPDALKGDHHFGVDHYRPKKLFPEFASDYANLSYACNCCNSWKGDFWPDIDQRNSGYFIPNPCDHVMFDHLRYRSEKVFEQSKAGRCAIEILDLNDETHIEYRRAMLYAITAVVDKRNRVSDTISKLDDVIGSTADPGAKAELVAAKRKHITRLGRAENALRILTGE